MSARQDIRDALVTAISGGSTGLGRVLAGRRDSLDPTDVAAGIALVYLAGFSAEPEGRNTGRRRNHQAEYMVDVYVAKSATLTEGTGAAPTTADSASQLAEEALDTYTTAIEAAIHTDLDLGNLVITCAVTGGEYAVEPGEASTAIGMASLRVTCWYRTSD